MKDKILLFGSISNKPEGHVKDFWLAKLLFYDHRYTYEDVQEIIEKKRRYFIMKKFCC